MAWRIEATSPWPRVVSAVSNQLKQRFGLLAWRCSGSSRAKPPASASRAQPVPSA